jgi:soluble lytic murein transglycosylase
LQTRYRSALVAALAGASLLAVTLATDTAFARGVKSTQTAKAAGKTAKASGKKVAGKSKDKSAPDKSAVPQIPLAQGPAPQTSAEEIARVKSALEALRHGSASKATEVAGSISDPAARNLVEWMILRSEHPGADSKRYLAFIAANPGWPSVGMFRKRAEAMLWVENIKPAQALSFFKDSPPQTGTGRLVLARALIAQGDEEAAKALIREAWRYDPLSTEVEKQALDRYSEFLGRADHKARMEKRLFAGDNEAAMRARCRRRRDRASAHRAQPQGRQCQETARRRAGGRAPRRRLSVLARAPSAARGQDRRGRAGAAVRALRPRPDL